MERSSFCVHPSAKKRIKSLICHWRELPSLVQIMLLPRHQINLSDIPLTFFSRLAHSWISSFMINWCKGYLTHISLSPLPATLKNPTGMVQYTCSPQSRDLLCFGAKFHPNLLHKKPLEETPEAADTAPWKSSKERQLRWCFDALSSIFWSLPDFFWASLKGRICLHHTAAYLRPKFCMIF